MKKILAISKFTIKENISNKLFNAFIGLGIILILGTVFLKEISLYEETKVIYDSGLFLIEFFIFLITVFTASTLVLKDTKEKSIYVVLTKPVSRSIYIIGKTLGLIATVLLNVSVMGGIFYGILVWQGAPVGLNYIYVLLFIFFKLAIVVSIGLFFSIISDSVITSNIFTLSVYVLGHAVYELKMLSEKMTNLVYKYILEGIYYILPNYRVLNYRDYLKEIDFDLSKITLYVIAYILVLTMLSNIFFNKKRL